MPDSVFIDSMRPTREHYAPRDNPGQNASAYRNDPTNQPVVIVANVSWRTHKRTRAPWSGWSRGRAGLEGSVRLAAHDRLEAGDVENADVLLLDGDEAVVLEAGEEAAHGLQRKAEEAADLVAGHAQVEFLGRVAARDEALRQVEQERGEAFLGAHRAEQHHHALVAHQLAAHHLVELALQARLLEAGVGNHAHLAVLQRERVGRVRVGADAVHAH